jgi:hypothetical protein
VDCLVDGSLPTPSCRGGKMCVGVYSKVEWHVAVRARRRRLPVPPSNLSIVCDSRGVSIGTILPRNTLISLP